LIQLPAFCCEVEREELHLFIKEIKAASSQIKKTKTKKLEIKNLSKPPVQGNMTQPVPGP